jgi:hypothetical protein
MCFKPISEERLKARRDAEERWKDRPESGPATRRRPPANQDIDRRELERAEERLLAPVGR